MNNCLLRDRESKTQKSRVTLKVTKLESIRSKMKTQIHDAKTFALLLETSSVVGVGPTNQTDKNLGA